MSEKSKNAAEMGEKVGGSGAGPVEEAVWVELLQQHWHRSKDEKLGGHVHSVAGLSIPLAAGRLGP